MEKTLRIMEMTWRGRYVMIQDGDPEITTGLGHNIRGILESLSWHIPDDYYSANRDVPFIQAIVIPFNESEISETYADDIAAGNVILSDDNRFVADFDPLTLSFTKLDKNLDRI